jgi:hypothetical protein
VSNFAKLKVLIAIPLCQNFPARIPPYTPNFRRGPSAAHGLEKKFPQKFSSGDQPRIKRTHPAELAWGTSKPAIHGLTRGKAGNIYPNKYLTCFFFCETTAAQEILGIQDKFAEKGIKWMKIA